MAATPNHLVNILDSITKGPQGMGNIESLHARQMTKVRGVFEDPNIVGVGAKIEAKGGKCEVVKRSQPVTAKG